MNKHKTKYTLKDKWHLFLLGFPYGLYGKVLVVEGWGERKGEGSYTLWDRIRYRLYVGEWL